MTLVLDAAVVVKGFVREDGHETAHRLFAIDAAWSAPSPLTIEVANTLWKKVRRGAFTAEAATKTVERSPRLPVRYVETVDLVAADRRLLARVHGTAFAARAVELDAFVAAQG